jgi:hypothetical protein
MEEALGRSLATGNTAEIFEWGSRVMKLYKSPAAKPAAFREAATSAAVEALGLPAPMVWNVHDVGGRWGLVFDRVTQKSFAEQMLGKMNDVPRYLECMVQLQIRVHSHQAIQFTGLKVTLAANIAASFSLDKLRKQELLDTLADMPDGDRLCHGDFHPLNILGDTSDPVILIGWTRAEAIRRLMCAVPTCCSNCMPLKLPCPTSTHTAASAIWIAMPCCAGCPTLRPRSSPRVSLASALDCWKSLARLRREGPHRHRLLRCLPPEGRFGSVAPF